MRWPGELTGGNPLVTWLNRLLGGSRSNTPLETKDFRVEFTTDGYFLRPKFQTIAAPQSLSPGVEFGLFQIFQRNLGDYLECLKVTSTGLVPDKNFQHLIPVQSSGGSAFPVAKQINMRLAGISGATVLKELVDTVTMNYSIPNGADNDNNRSSTDGANPKTEWVYPRYATNGEIQGIYDGHPLFNRIEVPMYAQCYILACKPAGGSGVFAYKGIGDKKDPASYTQVDWVEVGPNRSWISEA